VCKGSFENDGETRGEERKLKKSGSEFRRRPKTLGFLRLSLVLLFDL